MNFRNQVEVGKTRLNRCLSNCRTDVQSFGCANVSFDSPLGDLAYNLSQAYVTMKSFFLSKIIKIVRCPEHRLRHGGVNLLSSCVSSHFIL